MWVKSLLRGLGHEYVKTQLSGVGLALISAFLPTLGFSYWFQVGALILGVILLLWPLVAYGWNALRNMSPALTLFYSGCAFVAVGIWVMAWWNAPPTMPIASPSPLPGPSKLLSRMDRFIFACDVPPPSEEQATKLPQEMNRFKNNIELWGDAIGVTYDVVEIRGGIKIVAEATAPEAKRRLLGTPANKVTIEIRRIGQQELVTVFVDLPDILRFLSFMAPTSAREYDEAQRSIERLIGAPAGGCQLR